MSLTNFYPGTTKSFSVTISDNGSPPDITGDTVTLRFKQSSEQTDADAALTKLGDVATSGASGIALFTLTPSDTDDLLGGRVYYYDIVWETAGGEEHVLVSNAVQVLSRVSDASAGT